jgi:hypothetical protein
MPASSIWAQVFQRSTLPSAKPSQAKPPLFRLSYKGKTDALDTNKLQQIRARFHSFGLLALQIQEGSCPSEAAFWMGVRPRTELQSEISPACWCCPVSPLTLRVVVSSLSMVILELGGNHGGHRLEVKNIIRGSGFTLVLCISFLLSRGLDLNRDIIVLSD